MESLPHRGGDEDALADQLLSVPTDKGANAGGMLTALVAGMVAGADPDNTRRNQQPLRR